MSKGKPWASALAACDGPIRCDGNQWGWESQSWVSGIYYKHAEFRVELIIRNGICVGERAAYRYSFAVRRET